MKKLLAVGTALTVGWLVLWAQAGPRPSAAQKDDGKPAAQAKDAKSDDEKALLEAIFAYKEAFNRGDAKAVAEYYTEHAEVVDDKGEVIQGRDAIGKDFAKIFKENPGVQLEIAINWCHWLTNDSIVHHGAAKVTAADGTAAFATYTAVYVKRDGKWLIGMVREIPAAVEGASAQETNLEALAWLVGEWTDEGDNTIIEVFCDWSKNKTFLNRKFAVYAKEPAEGGTFKKKVVLECREIIGWDASRGILRSWIFDSQGGFGEGLWLRKGEHWYVKCHGVTREGKKASAVHVFTPAGLDQYAWRSVSRSVDGQLQPDIGEVTVRRVSPDTDK